MKAIDTNVLLRYLLKDDIAQFREASDFINGRDKVLLTDVVLAETLWVLKGKKYKLSKQALLAVLKRLFNEANFVFEDNQTVWNAVADYQMAGSNNGLDFSDALIYEKSRYVNASNDKSAHLQFKTFDGDFTMLLGYQRNP